MTNNIAKLCQTIDNIIKGIIKCYLQDMIFAFQEYKCKKEQRNEISNNN